MEINFSNSVNTNNQLINTNNQNNETMEAIITNNETNNQNNETMETEITKELINEIMATETENINLQFKTMQTKTMQTKTTQTSNIILEGLDSRTVYSLSELLDLGIQFTTLVANREINQRAVANKISSIKENGSIICPAIIVSTRACLDQGLEVTINGKEIDYNTPDLDMMVTICDGCHRAAAINKINSERDKNEPLVENYFIFPSGENVKVATMLKEANISTTPWKAKDYMRSLIVSNTPNSLELEKLKWIMAEYENCSESAIWHWVTLSNSHAPSKKKINDAILDKTKCTALADLEKFKSGKDLYLAFRDKIGKEIAGLKFVPKLFIALIDRDINKDTRLSESIKKYKRFIKELTPGNVVEIKGYSKSTKEVSKQQYIETTLKRLLKEFNKKQKMDQTIETPEPEQTIDLTPMIINN